MAKKTTTSDKSATPKKVAKKTSVKKAKAPKATKKKAIKKSVKANKAIIEDDIILEDIILNEEPTKKPAAPKKKRSPKKSKKKVVKEKKDCKGFSNPMTSLSSLVQENKSKKEPAGKFELEYVIGTSIPILYEFISSPSGLSEWFADDVNIRDGVFSFMWEGASQEAKLLNFKENKFIKFQWLDKPDGTYFEFRIEKDALTGDISLLVIDFAEEASDLESSKLLWDSQIAELMHVSGSY